MNTKSQPKEINLLNNILGESSIKISSLKDLSDECKIVKIISVM